MGVWPQLHQCVTHPGYDSRLSKACLKEDAEILEAEEQGNFKQRPFQSKPKLNKWKTLQVPSSQFFQTLPGNITLFLQVDVAGGWGTELRAPVAL